MYIRLAVIFTFLFFVGSISLFYVNGQLDSCKLFRSCVKETLPNGCRQTVRWVRHAGLSRYGMFERRMHRGLPV